jgi:hypothetical protein
MGKEFSVYPILDEDYKFIIKNNKTKVLVEIPYEDSILEFNKITKEIGPITQSENNLSDSVETITQEKFDKALKMVKLNNKINDSKKNLFSIFERLKNDIAINTPLPEYDDDKAEESSKQGKGGFQNGELVKMMKKKNEPLLQNGYM